MIAARKGYPIRVLKNKAAMTIRTMDESGAGQDEINTYVDKISRGGWDDRDNKLMSAGQVAGLIQRIMTVEELILDMVAEARRVAQNLGKRL
jgi:NAD(P)H-dependent flavin oxidoreductase YrpB (nitropropane dioxygenase family)